jgi:hypothetical protein
MSLAKHAREHEKHFVALSLWQYLFFGMESGDYRPKIDVEIDRARLKFRRSRKLFAQFQFRGFPQLLIKDAPVSSRAERITPPLWEPFAA